jgi:DNA-binding CsgD family transcriptional regulator
MSDILPSGVAPLTSVALTRGEAQCLELLGRGYSNSNIAKELGIAAPTVALHLVQARRKLGARSREQALLMAFQQGLIHP